MKLTVVIGANGAGKTTWTRGNRNRLPEPFYNADSIAEGLGDANSPESQRRARSLVDREISASINRREPFGFESTWSGKSRPQIVRNASEQGYETHAIFLGTEDVSLNIDRVRQRVQEGGHDVAESEIVRRWTAAYENLLANWDVFDQIDVLDSSSEDLRLIASKRGKESWVDEDLPEWAAEIRTRTIERSERGEEQANKQDCDDVVKGWERATYDPERTSTVRVEERPQQPESPQPVPRPGGIGC